MEQFSREKLFKICIDCLVQVTNDDFKNCIGPVFRLIISTFLLHALGVKNTKKISGAKGLK
jgi:hypothetical protein